MVAIESIYLQQGKMLVVLEWCRHKTKSFTCEMHVIVDVHAFSRSVWLVNVELPRRDLDQFRVGLVTPYKFAE